MRPALIACTRCSADAAPTIELRPHEARYVEAHKADGEHTPFVCAAGHRMLLRTPLDWRTCRCGARFARLPARGDEGEAATLDPERCAVCQASNRSEALEARRRHVERYPARIADTDKRPTDRELQASIARGGLGR